MEDDESKGEFLGYEVIINKADVEELIKASNDMVDLPTDEQFNILYQVSVVFLQNPFFNQLFSKKTGKLNFAISRKGVDYRTLKFVLATMIMKQVNEFTYFDYFNYDFKNDLEGAETSVSAYEPEHIFDALGFTIRNMIVSMDLYKAVESGDITQLLLNDPDSFITYDNLNTDNIVNKSNVDGDNSTEAFNNILVAFNGVYEYVNLENQVQDKKIEINAKNIESNKTAIENIEGEGENLQKQITENKKNGELETLQRTKLISLNEQAGHTIDLGIGEPQAETIKVYENLIGENFYSYFNAYYSKTDAVDDDELPRLKQVKDLIAGGGQQIYTSAIIDDSGFLGIDGKNQSIINTNQQVLLNTQNDRINDNTKDIATLNKEPYYQTQEFTGLGLDFSGDITILKLNYSYKKIVGMTFTTMGSPASHPSIPLPIYSMLYPYGAGDPASIYRNNETDASWVVLDINNDKELEILFKLIGSSIDQKYPTSFNITYKIPKSEVK